MKGAASGQSSGFVYMPKSNTAIAALAEANAAFRSPLAVVTIEELIELLGVSAWTIASWIKQGWFPPPFRGPNGLGPRRWFVADVERAMREMMMREADQALRQRGRELHEAAERKKRPREKVNAKPKRRTVGSLA